MDKEELKMINTLEDLCKFWMPDDEQYLVMSTNVNKNTFNYFGSNIAQSYVPDNDSFVKSFIQHCYGLALKSSYGPSSTTAKESKSDSVNNSESERLMNIKTLKGKNQIILTKTIVKYIVKDSETKLNNSVIKKDKPKDLKYRNPNNNALTKGNKLNGPLIGYGHPNESDIVDDDREDLVNDTDKSNSSLCKDNETDDLTLNTDKSNDSLTKSDLQSHSATSCNPTNYSVNEFDKPMEGISENDNSNTCSSLMEYDDKNLKTFNNPNNDCINEFGKRKYSETKNKKSKNSTTDYCYPNNSVIKYGKSKDSEYEKSKNSMTDHHFSHTAKINGCTNDSASDHPSNSKYNYQTDFVTECVKSIKVEIGTDIIETKLSVDIGENDVGSMNINNLSTGENVVGSVNMNKLSTLQKNEIRKMKAIYKERPRFKCHICKHLLDSDLILQNHLNEHAVFDAQDVDDHSCPVCSKVFNYRKNLKEHYRLHSKPVLYQCSICDEKFGRAAHYKKHMKIHKNSDAELSQYQRLNHIKTSLSSQDKNLTEKTGGESQTSQSLDHDDSKSGIVLPDDENELTKMDESGPSLDMTYPCELCDRMFDTEKGLYHHSRLVHSMVYPNDVCLECEICNKTFCNKQSLQIHQKCIHEKTKEYVCGHCGKTFTRPYSLKEHMYIHQKEKFTCSVCGNVLSSPNSFKNHMKLHADFPQFVCETCGKTFKQRSNFIIHTKYTHTEASFQCEICPKILKSKQRWRLHMRLHACREGYADTSGLISEKIYDCNICSKKFATSYQLKCHLRAHSSERPYKCDRCEKSYKEYSKLKRHRQLAHEILDQDSPN